MRWIFCLMFLSIPAIARAQETQSADAAAAPATQPTEVVPADQLLTQMLKPQEEKAKPIQPIAGPPAADATSGSGALGGSAPEIGRASCRERV